MTGERIMTETERLNARRYKSAIEKIAQLRAELAAVRSEQLAAFDEMGKHHRAELDMQRGIIKALRTDLAAARQEADSLREALSLLKTGYENLIEVGALPHADWDADAQMLINTARAALDATETPVSQPVSNP